MGSLTINHIFSEYSLLETLQCFSSPWICAGVRKPEKLAESNLMSPEMEEWRWWWSVWMSLFKHESKDCYWTDGVPSGWDTSSGQMVVAKCASKMVSSREIHPSWLLLPVSIAPPFQATILSKCNQLCSSRKEAPLNPSGVIAENGGSCWCWRWCWKGHFSKCTPKLVYN